MSNLRINIKFQFHEVGEMLFKIDIVDKELNPVKELWIRPYGYNLFKLDPGTYGVRLNLSSGENIEKVVVLKENETAKADFNLEKLSPHEQHQWAYISQSLGPAAEDQLSKSRFAGAWIRFWEKNKNGWEIKPVPIEDESSWYADGVSYTLNVSKKLHVLQVGGPNIPWRFVTLPPNPRLLCLIRPAKGPSTHVHPLGITVSTDKWNSEALLSFLNTGSMGNAHKMINASHEAERMLFQKMSDPVGAAIGGYYLLRCGELDRLHTWAKNLANWMDWMSDGAVIRAWQIIKQSQRSNSSLKQAELKKQLLSAVERGFPFYTEGSRLLYEGLKLLNKAYSNNDPEVKGALGTIEKYIAAIDWSTTTTTFNGIRPDQPDAKSAKGTPGSKDPKAYIFDVPMKEIIRHGYIDSEDKITMDRTDGFIKELTVMKSGKLKTPDGQEFISPLQAISYYTKKDESVSLKTKDSSRENLNIILERFRRGEF